MADTGGIFLWLDTQVTNLIMGMLSDEMATDVRQHGWFDFKAWDAPGNMYILVGKKVVLWFVFFNSSVHKEVCF